MRTASKALVVALVVVIAGCASGGGPSGAPAAGGGDGGAGGVQGGAAATGTGNLGYAVGGANDVNNFRDNVANGYLPLESDMTHEGLFYDYYFDTGTPETCRQMFCPTYSRAVTADPLSGETEHYMTVGLNSNISKEAFERPKLNLVVVVDVSGSMAESFDQYYYDDGERVESERQPKIEAAKRALQGMLDQLRPGDRVGIVAYSDRARRVAEMRAVGERDMEAVRSAVGSLRADGSTNLAAGMELARTMAEPYAGRNPGEYETRVVYITDAMPNTGDTASASLQSRLETDAENGVYSTFVGVGVDFNSRLVEGITDVEGANYYSVHSGAQFDRRMDEQVRYMVTPLVFDLSLEVQSQGWAIEKVYGTTGADAASGELLHVETLFPAPTSNGSTKGGVILVQLERTGNADSLTLTASYEDRTGTRHETSRTVTFADREPEYFESSAVRKAVLLSRYADLTQNWIAYERAQLSGQPTESPDDGIAPHEDRDLGKWERESADLRVSPVYRERFRAFLPYFRSEMEALGDESLRRELEVLRTLANYGEGDPEDGAEAATSGTVRWSGGAGTLVPMAARAAGTAT